MNENYVESISRELNIQPHQVRETARLLEEGATVPFIARYRKEATGSLDEVLITSVRDRLSQLEALDKRRAAILKSLTDTGKLTDELEARLMAADRPAVLEDIYLPFRPKRRTRAAVARERGLEPLASLLFEQKPGVHPTDEAGKYVDAEKGTPSAEDALAGARDIIAEWINEDANARARLRTLFAGKGVLRSSVVAGKEEEGARFRDYHDKEEALKGAPSHRILAVLRGEKEGVLTVRVGPPEDDALQVLEGIFVKGDSEASQQVRTAAHDSYKRLLAPSLETEARHDLKTRADAEAIQVFADNLRHLLMAPPLGSKRVMALDPGFRTGCKVVCLDPRGKLLHNETVFPHSGNQAAAKAAERIRALAAQFEIEAVAIGNGTAGRETEAFIRGLDLSQAVQIVFVDESGASVYSASSVAREEFPDHDVTVRGAVSIGRRLIDPLSELVKIDPKSIGVGQYQHDVDQGDLKRSLDDTVVSCVNAVGVEVNTASPQLLSYVSGIGGRLAGNIVAYRQDKGAFRSREALIKVPQLGPRAFQQSAGFLRISDGGNPLDASAVHPESYSIVERMARDLGCSPSDLMRDGSLRTKIDPARYVTKEAGLPTLRDILSELAKPGRDPRTAFESFSFAPGIEKPEDLEVGMVLPGLVTNVTAFGAFVDIGVHRDGLIHVSELSDQFVKDPRQVVQVHQKVTVTVIEVDHRRGRISLSMKRSRDRAREAREGTGPSPEKAGPAPAASRENRTGPGKAASSPEAGRREKAPRPGKKSGFNNPFEEAFKKP